MDKQTLNPVLKLGRYPLDETMGAARQALPLRMPLSSVLPGTYLEAAEEEAENFCTPAPCPDSVGIPTLPL